MSKLVAAAIALFAVVLAIVLLRPNNDDDRTPAGGAAHETSDDTGAADDRGSASDRATVGDSARAGALANRPGSGAPADRRGEAAAVRDRLAAAGARAAAQRGQGAGAVPTDDDGVAVDASAADALPRVALQPKESANQNDSQSESGADTTAAEQQTAAGPDVAYDSGLDKSFALEKQTQAPDVGKIDGAAGTVTFWVKPGWEAGNQDDATFVQLGDSGLHFAKNVNFLRFEFFDRNGVEQGLGTDISEWKDEWHQVVGTWVGTSYQLFVDGKPISLTNFVTPPDFQEQTNVYIGSNFLHNAPAAAGEVTGVRVSNLPTSAGEIAKRYEAGQRPR